jgi:hypothetical protein
MINDYNNKKGNTMLQLTHNEFVEKLNNFNGVTFMSCSIETPVKMNKGGRMGVPTNPFDNVFKHSSIHGGVGFDYQNSVNLQRGREQVVEEFKTEPRRWGQLLEGGKFVEHKGNYYLQLKVESVKPNIVYTYTGEEIDKSELETWLPKKSKSSRQDVQREVIVRDIKLNNIKNVTFGKQTYELVKNDII